MISGICARRLAGRLAALALCSVPAFAWAEPPWPTWFIVTALAFSLLVPVTLGAVIGVITSSRKVRVSRAAAIACVAVFLLFYLVIVVNGAAGDLPSMVAALFPVATLGAPLVLGIVLGHRWLRRSQGIDDASFVAIPAGRKHAELAIALVLTVLITGLDAWLHMWAPPQGPALACAQFPVKAWRIEDGAGDDAVLAVTVAPSVAGTARIGWATLRTSGFVPVASVTGITPDQSVEMKAGQDATLRAPYRWQRHADLVSARLAICPGASPPTDAACAVWAYGGWTQEDGKRYCNYPSLGDMPPR